MITIRNVSRTIDNNPILNDISLDVPEDGITALIGLNDTGKSTLLSFIARLQPLVHGDISYAGKNTKTTPAAEPVRALSILTQKNSIMSRITVRDLLMFGRYPYHQGRPSEADKTIVEETLAEFRLQGFTDRYLTELSGGQRQHAVIATVFCQRTNYVLLDGPLNSLDMYYAHSLMQILRRPTDEYKRTAVVVLHDTNQAAAYTDHVVVMKGGQVAMQDVPNDIFTAKDIKSLSDMDVNVLDYEGKKLVIHHI